MYSIIYKKNLKSNWYFFITDLLGKSFVPLKTEVKGHIKGLETKYLADTNEFRFIQLIMKNEQISKKSAMPSSATSAILWIYRNLKFLHSFLKNFVQKSEEEIQECLEISYKEILMEHHDQVIRSVFAVSTGCLFEREKFEQILKSLIFITFVQNMGHWQKTLLLLCF